MQNYRLILQKLSDHFYRSKEASWIILNRVCIALTKPADFLVKTRVSDPDPGGSGIFSAPGSGSGSRSHKFVRNCSFSSKILTNSMVKTGLRIRIRIREDPGFFQLLDPDPWKYFRSDPDPGKNFPDPKLWSAPSTVTLHIWMPFCLYLNVLPPFEILKNPFLKILVPSFYHNTSKILIFIRPCSGPPLHGCCAKR